MDLRNMAYRNGAHDEHYDVLIVGSGLGGNFAVLRLTKEGRGYRVRVLAAGRKWPDNGLAESDRGIKRLAWRMLGLKRVQRIYSLPTVLVDAGVGVGGGSPLRE
jgi:cholesterol oxidase